MVLVLVSVVFGVAAALLLVTGPTVVVDGVEQGCPGIIVSAEGGGGPAACGPVQERWLWYAVAAGLISLAAGTGAAFRQPKGSEGSATRTRESSDID